MARKERPGQRCRSNPLGSNIERGATLRRLARRAAAGASAGGRRGQSVGFANGILRGQSFYLNHGSILDRKDCHAGFAMEGRAPTFPQLTPGYTNESQHLSGRAAPIGSGALTSPQGHSTAVGSVVASSVHRAAERGHATMVPVEASDATATSPECFPLQRGRGATDLAVTPYRLAT